MSLLTYVQIAFCLIFPSGLLCVQQWTNIVGIKLVSSQLQASNESIMQVQLHKFWDPVQNENAGRLVQKSRGKVLLKV